MKLIEIHPMAFPPLCKYKGTFQRNIQGGLHTEIIVSAEFFIDNNLKLTEFNVSLPTYSQSDITLDFDIVELVNVTLNKIEDLRVFELFSAVLNNNYWQAQALLEEGCDVNYRFKQKATLLHIVSKQKDTKMANLLLWHGADPNLIDNLGWTPLLLATHSSNKEMVHLFLKSGANPHFKFSQLNQNSIEMALSTGQNKIANLLKHFKLKTLK